MAETDWPSLDEIGPNPDPNLWFIREMIASGLRLYYSEADYGEGKHTFEVVENIHPQDGATFYLVPVNYGQQAVGVHLDRAEAEAQYRNDVLGLLDNCEPGEGAVSVDVNNWGLPQAADARLRKRVDQINNPASNEEDSES